MLLPHFQNKYTWVWGGEMTCPSLPEGSRERRVEAEAHVQVLTGVRSPSPLLQILPWLPLSSLLNLHLPGGSV